MSIQKRIENDLQGIKKSSKEISELAKKDIERCKGQTERIKELAKTTKEHILKDLNSNSKEYHKRTSN